MFDQVTGQIGQNFQSANDAFLSQFKPIFDGFTASLTGVKTPVDNFGNDLDRTRDPINRFIDRINSAADRLEAFSKGNGTTFTQWTQQQRAQA
jgi:hypothetical protein